MDQKSRNRGYAPAQNQLGTFFANSYGVSLDDAKALGYFKQAADQQDGAAARNIGKFLRGR